MNKNSRLVRATIVFGFIAALCFMPAVRTLDFLLTFKESFFIVTWITLFLFALFLARRSETKVTEIIFPLFVPAVFIFIKIPGYCYLLIIVAVLSWIRSGICFKGQTFKKVAAELLICPGAGILIWYLNPGSDLGWTLSVWLFFLVQSVYSVLFVPFDERIYTSETDRFEKIRREAEEILSLHS